VDTGISVSITLARAKMAGFAVFLRPIHFGFTHGF
jgi:hypothetical protein